MMDVPLPRLPNLNWLRTFEAAARLGSFTAAGNELGLTQTAVSLQIKSLETKLGYELFTRRARNIQLTELGRAYLPAVRKAIDELAQSTHGLFGPDIKRMITVRAPISTAALWLAPKLSNFRQAEPDIAVRLVTTIWADSITESDVDVDVRFGEGNWTGLISHKLSEERIVPICLKGQSGLIPSAVDLQQGCLIHILGYDDHWSKYFAASGLEYDAERIGLSVDTTVAAFELVATGAGYAAVVNRFARCAINVGRPVETAGEPVAIDGGHYLVESPRQEPPKPEAEVFKSWLREIFSDSV